MNKIIRMLLLVCLMGAMILTAVACTGRTGDPKDTQAGGETVTNEKGEVVTKEPGTDTDAASTESGENTAPVDPISIKLSFNGTSLTSSDNTAVVVDTDANAFVIVKAGVYELTGDLSNGQVRVQVEKTEEVTLIFNGFTASSAKSAPVYIVSCDKCTIELADGTVNRLSDAAVYQYPDANTDKPNACLYSSDDLTIKGNGTLIIEANYNNGIGVKNDLKIKNGTIKVTAPNNILKGNDSVTISGGKLTLSGGEDAIKSDSEKQGKGFVLISEDAEISITCADDAIQASQSVTVESGTKVTVTAGGDPINCPGVINGSEYVKTADAA